MQTADDTRNSVKEEPIEGDQRLRRRAWRSNGGGGAGPTGGGEDCGGNQRRAARSSSCDERSPRLYAALTPSNGGGDRSQASVGAIRQPAAASGVARSGGAADLEKEEATTADLEGGCGGDEQRRRWRASRSIGEPPERRDEANITASVQWRLAVDRDDGGGANTTATVVGVADFHDDAVVNGVCEDEEESPGQHREAMGDEPMEGIREAQLVGSQCLKYGLAGFEHELATLVIPPLFPFRVEAN
ncbi:hypothetical protein Scep_010633 [Stephania cephalantha]|uniref:Uncharacterized protein n=1 Tax=Stephania cephalantha TaxID=152367 RepID=A0AAP0JVI2_9MAGN